MDKTALAASSPLFGLLDFFLPHRSKACFLFKAVMMPLPIIFSYLIDKFKMASNDDLHIKSKCGVLPFMTQPIATNASNFLIFFLLLQVFLKYLEHLTN